MQLLLVGILLGLTLGTILCVYIPRFPRAARAVGMQLLAGLLLGITLGVFFGIYLARIPDAVRATGIGFGAGIGIFSLGSIVRYVADRTDKAFGRIKEGKAI